MHHMPWQRALPASSSFVRDPVCRVFDVHLETQRGGHMITVASSSSHVTPSPSFACNTLTILRM